jgi:outer membrane protein assembly factor BamB
MYTESFADTLEAPLASPWSSPAPTADSYYRYCGFQFTVTPASGGLRRVGVTASAYALSADTAGASVTVAIPAGLVGGAKDVAARFYLTDGDGAFTPGDVTITLNDSTTQTLSPTSADTGSFCGFDSTDAITSLTITTPAAGSYITLDDIILSNPDAPRRLVLDAPLADVGMNAHFPVSPSFSVRKYNNDLVADYTAPVTVSLQYGTDPAPILNGTTTVNAVDGVATFSDLSVTKPTFGVGLTAVSGFMSTEPDRFTVTLASFGQGTTLSTPTASAEGVMYFGDSKGYLHAVNTSTGASVFSINTVAGVGVAPEDPERQALGRLMRWNLGGKAMVLCVTSDNYLLAFDLLGNPVWTAKLDGGGTAVIASAMVCNDTVYVAAANATDTVITRLNNAGEVTGTLHLAGTSTSPVSVFGNSIFVSTGAGSFCLQASDFAVLNTFAAGVAAPFIASTATSPVAIVVTSDGKVNAYSASTGNALSTFGDGGSVDLGMPESLRSCLSLATFTATVGHSPTNVEGFDSLEAPLGPSWTSPLLNGMQFTAAATWGVLRCLTTNKTPNCLSAVTAGSAITLTFSGGVRAVGGRFFVTDDAGTPLPAGPLSFEVNGVPFATVEPNSTPFYGIHSTRDILTLKIIANDPLVISTDPLVHVAMDNVTISRTPNVSAAPFVYGGRIYVGGMDDNVYCLNLADGSPAGFNDTNVFFDAVSGLSEEPMYLGAILDGVGICPSSGGTDNGTLVFGNAFGFVFSVRLTDGQPIGFTLQYSKDLVDPESSSAPVRTFTYPIYTAPAYDPITKTFSFGASSSIHQMSRDTRIPFN